MARRGLPPLDGMARYLLGAIVLLLLGAVVVQWGPSFLDRTLGPVAAPSASPRAAAGAPATRETRVAPVATGRFLLRTTNTLGRSGVLFVPRLAEAGPRPLLVLFHGTGGTGAQILRAFSSEAEARGIIVMAADSGRSPDGGFNWRVPDQQGETTADQEHVAACLAELYATPGLMVDPARTLAAGHSGGASSAAYLATNDARFHAFAVLHGGVFPGGLGGQRPAGWFSTGADDALRPPAVMERAASVSAPYAASVVKHVYPGGHELSAAEIRGLLSWWLPG